MKEEILMKAKSFLFEKLIEDNKETLDLIEENRKTLTIIPFIKIGILLLLVGCWSISILMISHIHNILVIIVSSVVLLVVYFILGKWNLNKKNKSSYEKLATQLQRNIRVLLNKEDIGIDGIKLLKEEAQYYKKSTSNLVKEQFKFLTRFLGLLIPGALLYKGIILLIKNRSVLFFLLAIILGILVFCVYYYYEQKDHLKTSKYQLLYDILFNIEIDETLKSK